MANKINVKLIIELHEGGMSQNAIAKFRHISKHSVSDVIRIASKRAITYENIKDKSDDEVYQLFYPDRNQVQNIYEPVDYDYVHEELKKTGVTLKLLWEEYCDQCLERNVIPR